MTKRELIASLERHCNNAGFISKKELQEYLGYKSPTSVNKFIYRLNTIGGSKKYFIPDVAEVLMETEV